MLIKQAYAVRGKTIKLNFNIRLLFSQLDGKLLEMLSGLRGAFCTMCHVTKKDAKDPAFVEVRAY